MSEITESYQRAADGFARRLAAVSDEQWGSPTPCSDWSVRNLVAHVLDEQLWVPPLVGGETIAEVGDRFAGDQIGSDAIGSWTRAQAGVLAALAPDGAIERRVQLSFGETSAAEYLTQVTVDTVVHTWDLARAVGADDSLDPADVQTAIVALSPQVEAWRAGGAFGPAVSVDPNADAQTRLLAMLGRERA